MRSASVGHYDELHHERANAARVFKAIDLRNVMMVQRGKHAGFTIEARQAIGIVRKGLGKDFDRDIAIQLRVAGSVHLAHAASTEGRQDFVTTQACACRQGHWLVRKAIIRTR